MTSPTKVRTYSRERTLHARAAWAEGRFSPEWVPWRRLAAKAAGIIHPPEGTEWDQWDVDHPSQRAILIRAIRETPELLRKALHASAGASWAAVIEALLADRVAMRDEAYDRIAAEGAWLEAKAADREGAGAALERLDGVLARHRTGEVA